jgi:hypothetical protein
MPTISTLGHPSRRTEFTYTGNAKEGITLEFTGRPHISDEFFNAVYYSVSYFGGVERV